MALKKKLKGAEDDTLWKEIDADESSWELEKDSKGRRCIICSLMKKGKWGTEKSLAKRTEVGQVGASAEV